MRRGRSETTATLHLELYLEFAEKAEKPLVGPDQLSWLDRLDAEQDNLRAALAHARETNVAQGLRLASSVVTYWLLHGQVMEGAGQLKALLERAAEGATEARGRALAASGLLAVMHGDLRMARRFHEEELATVQADNLPRSSPELAQPS